MNPIKKPICILLIHGFGGSTYEVEPLAAELRKSDIPVFLVRLAGHGDDYKPIANISYRLWLSSVRVEIERLETKYRVLPVGFSMGGLIAATLYSEFHFSGMVFINTPIYFWNIPQVVKNFLTDFEKARIRYSESAGGVTNYSMVQFVRLLLNARNHFSEIDCPVLVVQADNDDTVWPASAKFICKKLRQPPVFYKAPAGGHPILLNEEECKKISCKVERLYRKIVDE